LAAPRKPDLERRRREKVLILDGAMGTAIMAAAVADDYQGHEGCHDFLSVSRPDLIAGIHRGYLEAGCDIIETNTFEAQELELAKHGLAGRALEINRQAAGLAARAAADFSSREQPRFVAGSIGPGSRLPSLQQVEFQALEDSYYPQALGLFEGGVDLFQVETCQDMLQAKAALRALSRVFREKGSSRPVTLLVTLEKGRMLLGTDIATALATFLPFPLFAFGVNCGTGPEGMAEAVRTLSASSPFPLAVMPNAGLPRYRDGKYVYDLEPALFARQLRDFVTGSGAAIVGGCCGSTRHHIRALARALEGVAPVLRRKPVAAGRATSLFAAQDLKVKPRPLIIGEQTNATGSRKFKSALLADDLDAMLAVAQEQANEGAHLLDLNVAFAGRDEAGDMDRAVAGRECPQPPAADAGQRQHPGAGGRIAALRRQGGDQLHQPGGRGRPCRGDPCPGTRLRRRRGLPGHRRAGDGADPPKEGGRAETAPRPGPGARPAFPRPVPRPADLHPGIGRSRPVQRRGGDPGRPETAEGGAAPGPHPARGQQYFLRPAAGGPAHHQCRFSSIMPCATAWTPPSSTPAGYFP